MTETNNKIPFSSICREIRKWIRTNSCPVSSDYKTLDFMPCDLKIWVGRDSDFFHRSFCHHRMILKVILSGKGSTNIDGVRYFFSPGEAVLYFPMQTHSTETEDSGDFEYLAITFVQGMGQYDALRVLKNQVFSFVDDEKKLLSELVKVYQENRTIRSACVLAELLASLVQRITGNMEQDVGRFGQIASYIREHCSDELSVKQMANQFQVSEQTVQRIFQKNIPGVTPGVLIRKQRMILGEDLLRRTALPLQEIASRCGFSSPYSFSRAFRREYGMPPASYRKKHQ